MSWLSGYKSKPAPEEDPREARRKKLEAETAERRQRTQQRAARQKQLQAAIESREAADQALKELNQALKELLEIDPDIFEGPDIPLEDIPEDILDDEVIMVDFDQQNEDDSATALDNLRTVQCPFNKEDIEFWFSQLEDQLTLIGVKKQWTKKIALVRFLPPDIQTQVKSLLKLGQTAAGADIYIRLKRQLLKLYGPKPEDAYNRAKNRVLTDKPSQLGKLLVEDLCPAEIKLDGCHCANTVWGMFREKIPIIIRNHIADMPFNKDTYETIFDKADQVWDSNRADEPLPNRQVAATTPASAQTVQKGQEVAAVQNKSNGGQKNKNNKGQNKGQSNKGNQSGQNSQKDQGQSAPKPKVNDDNLCRIHAKWKENATFCAAPWACRMKNVWKAPQ